MNPELIKATTKVSLSDDGWTLNVLSTRVATITDPKGNRKTTYFGFDSIEKAEAFKDFVETHSMVTGLCLRKAARLNTEWECKCWGVSHEFIQALVARDRSD